MYSPHREEFVYSNKRWDGKIFLCYGIYLVELQKRKRRERMLIYTRQANKCWFEKAAACDAQKTEKHVST